MLREVIGSVLESRRSVEEDIVILPTVKGDSCATDVEENDEDVCHKNELLPGAVAEAIQVHKHSNDECKVAFEGPAVHSEEKTNDRQRKRGRKQRQWPGKRKPPEENIKSKCYIRS